MNNFQLNPEWCPRRERCRAHATTANAAQMLGCEIQKVESQGAADCTCPKRVVTSMILSPIELIDEKACEPSVSMELSFISVGLSAVSF